MQRPNAAVVRKQHVRVQPANNKRKHYAILQQKTVLRHQKCAPVTNHDGSTFVDVASVLYDFKHRFEWFSTNHIRFTSHSSRNGRNDGSGSYNKHLLCMTMTHLQQR